MHQQKSVITWPTPEVWHRCAPISCPWEKSPRASMLRPRCTSRAAWWWQHDACLCPMMRVTWGVTQGTYLLQPRLLAQVPVPSSRAPGGGNPTPACAPRCVLDVAPLLGRTGMASAGWCVEKVGLLMPGRLECHLAARLALLSLPPCRGAGAAHLVRFSTLPRYLRP